MGAQSRIYIFTAYPRNEHSWWKLRSLDTGEKANQNLQEITQNVVNVFIFYAIIASNIVFQCNVACYYGLP